MSDREEITEGQAIKLFESKFWEDMTHRQRAEFQMRAERLCMPFDVFHEAVEKTLGRPVWTHEFAYSEGLMRELRGERPPPTMEEIINLIPDHARVIVIGN